MSAIRRRWRMVAFWGVIVSVAPYVLVKIAWLAGSDFGMLPGAGTGEMSTPRFVIGNTLTLGMDLMAVLLALALVKPWGRRVPAWLVFTVGGAATGLLAPILIGVPLGSALQLVIEGRVTSGAEGNLQGWMFAMIYGGFGLMAVALAILLGLYAEDRWGDLIATGPCAPQLHWVTVISGIGMLLYAVAMFYWGVIGPGAAGPAGMNSVAQRSVLVVIALAAMGGFLAPLLTYGSQFRARAAAVITWVGCATAALQPVTGLLLAHDGQVSALGIALAAVTTPVSVLYGLAVMRATRAGPPSDSNAELARRDTELYGRHHGAGAVAGLEMLREFR
ncbi:MAG: hypothetical protein WED09_12205 [Homoserinimonas sp.]